MTSLAFYKETIITIPKKLISKLEQEEAITII